MEEKRKLLNDEKRRMREVIENNEIPKERNELMKEVGKEFKVAKVE